ncbi:hypothetical protein BGZ81_005022 [Podila clonocystis]|nr:hypothetical protein BGZ81_005022 [Podila clonocystis]
MSTTTDFPFHIPHIVENIADYFLFSDLVNCILFRSINYIIDRDMNSVDTGLQDLAKLISMNPHLYAVSIENVAMSCEAVATEYNRFVDFLDKHPAITNIYLEAHEALEPEVT